jgi:hypothetical protein
MHLGLGYLRLASLDCRSSLLSEAIRPSTWARFQPETWFKRTFGIAPVEVESHECV